MTNGLGWLFALVHVFVPFRVRQSLFQAMVPMLGLHIPDMVVHNKQNLEGQSHADDCNTILQSQLN